MKNLLVKKSIAMVLVFSVLFALAACASPSGGDTAPAPAAAETAPAPAAAEAATPAPDPAPTQELTPVTIRFATQTISSGSAMDQILEQWAVDFPHVTIELEEAPGTDLIRLVTVAIQGNNPPDVFTYWRPEPRWDFDQFVAVGAIADLTEFSQDPFFDGMFPDYAWATASMPDGMVVGVPRVSFFSGFFVNGQIFEAHGIDLPTDWDRLVTATQRLHELGYIVWVTDTGEGQDNASRLFNAVIGGHVGNDRGLRLMTGQESWQQPEVIQGLDYFLQVARPGFVAEDAPILDFGGAISRYFNTGEGGMIVGHAGMMFPNLTEESMDWVVPLAFPRTPTSAYSGPFNELDLTNLVYASYRAFNDPVMQPYIQEFIKRLTSREAATMYAEINRYIVPHLGLNLNPAYVHPLQVESAAIAAGSTAHKWMLSFTSPVVVDDFRIAINQSFNGFFATGEDLAIRLDEILYGTQ